MTRRTRRPAIGQGSLFATEETIAVVVERQGADSLPIHDGVLTDTDRLRYSAWEIGILLFGSMKPETPAKLRVVSGLLSDQTPGWPKLSALSLADESHRRALQHAADRVLDELRSGSRRFDHLKLGVANAI